MVHIAQVVKPVLDEINELAADHFGDILLDSDGSVYTVLEDYCDMAESMIRRN